MWVVTCKVFDVGWANGVRIGNWSLVDRAMKANRGVVEMPSWGASIEYDREDPAALFFGALSAAKMLEYEVRVEGEPPSEPDYYEGEEGRVVF